MSPSQVLVRALREVTNFLFTTPVSVPDINRGGEGTHDPSSFCALAGA